MRGIGPGVKSLGLPMHRLQDLPPGIAGGPVSPRCALVVGSGFLVGSTLAVAMDIQPPPIVSHGVDLFPSGMTTTTAVAVYNGGGNGLYNRA